MSQPLTIVVPVKHVPDAAGDRVLAGSPPLLERASGILSELDEYALEAAAQIVETHGGAAAGHRVLALTLGPAGATGALKRALQLGADAGFHVLDDALAGSERRQVRGDTEGLGLGVPDGGERGAVLGQR